MPVYPENIVSPEQQQPTPPGQGATPPTQNNASPPSTTIPPVVSPTSGVPLTPSGVLEGLYNVIAKGAAAYQQNPSDVQNIYVPPPRPASDPRFRPADTPAGQTEYLYQDSGLVDVDGNILTREVNGVDTPYLYYPEQDGVNAYLSSTPAQQRRVIDMLERKGYAMETSEQIQSGYALLHQFSNDIGRSFGAATLIFDQSFPDNPVRKEPTYTLSSAADIRATFRQSYRNLTGQLPTDALQDQFVRDYQRSQSEYQIGLQEGEGGIEAPAPIAVATEEFAQQRRPNLVERTKELGSWNKLFNSIRGPWG